MIQTETPIDSAQRDMGSPASDESAVGPDNVQNEKPHEQRNLLGIVKEDQDKLVLIATTYREGWAPDRLLRIPSWMKNILMYRGSQVLAWDPNSGTYFDALSWWKQNRDTEQDEIFSEKFICNITQMFGVGFKGMMSRGVPQTVVRPENAEILADVTTAEAAQEAIAIIERMNRIRQMVRQEFETLYLMGSYFKYTRGVLDGNWAGFDEEEVFGDVQVVRPDRYHCFNCNTDTPVGGGGLGALTAAATPKGGRSCQKCGMQLGPETFYPGSASLEMGIVGMQKIPRAMVKQTVHSPMEVDADPNAKDLEGTPILAFDQEIDIGEARMMFPAIMQEHKEGMESSTTPNASYERLRRNEMTSVGSGYTADSLNERPTYSQIWMQPVSYYRLGDQDFADRMLRVAPDGLKLTMVGSKVADIRLSVLTKEWSHCRLHEGFGLYSPAVADNVVPFNERFNDVMQKIDEWVATSSTGMNLIDGARLDKREMSGKAMDSGVLNEVPMKIHGDYRPLSEAFIHYDIPIAPQVFSYPNMLLQFCQLIACLPPQATGSGTLPGVETAKGQKQMLDIASNALNIYWENGKEEHAAAAQNAIECLQKLMKAGAVQELVDVIQDKGSQFRNNYVNLQRMNGRVKIYPDIDQGLPQSPEEIRAVFQTIFEQVGRGNAAAAAIMDVPTNRETMMKTLGTPDLVVPDAAQQSKTEQAINTLLEKDWVPILLPNGTLGQDLPVKPSKNVEKFPILKDVIRLFMQENSDIEQSNPQGWARLNAYYELAEQMELGMAVQDAQRKLQVSSAGSPQPPQPPPPDPNLEAAKADLIGKARETVDRLDELAHLPPLGKNGSISGQVSAGAKILDTAQKVAVATAQ